MDKVKIITVLLLFIAIIFISNSYYKDVYKPAQNLKNGFVVVKEFKCPESHPIKANLKSMIYHTRNSSYYSKTDASNGKCFDTIENVKKQGFRAPYN